MTNAEGWLKARKHFRELSAYSPNARKALVDFLPQKKPKRAPAARIPFLSLVLQALGQHEPEFLKRIRPRIERTLKGEV